MSGSVLVGISFKESAEKELDRLQKSMASGFDKYFGLEITKTTSEERYWNTRFLSAQYCLLPG